MGGIKVKVKVRQGDLRDMLMVSKKLAAGESLSAGEKEFIRKHFDKLKNAALKKADKLEGAANDLSSECAFAEEEK